LKQHSYKVQVEWTGNDGEGTKTYKSYRRDYIVSSQGKAPVPGSSDAAFRGDPSRFNPEDFLVASLSSCHMLSYLHLCAMKGVVVLEYTDDASGSMVEAAGGAGDFTVVRLSPKVRISNAEQKELALALHHDAHEICFIARSVKFPVELAPEIFVG
jgi:organic hydroperoxide reductase OsmC/OhrA